MSTLQVSESKGVRYLHFGSPWVQGAMRIARPYALELEYTRELMFPLLLRGDGHWPRSVLQVGLGAASVTRFLHRHFPAARQTIVELSADVVQAARHFFKLPAEVPVLLADGADYVVSTEARFDLIVLDGFDDRGRAGRLDTVPFYFDVARRLTRSGCLAVNMLTRTRGAAPALGRLAEAFGDRVLELPATEAGNVVAICAAGPRIDLSIEELRAAAIGLKASCGLDLRPTVARLEARGPRLVL